MRKETSNQFTEGLVSDLNPIATPNTILTDNLNGTIITYNGNEYSLQNDRGNYELKYCRLNKNYIPVGIKEYGDILYIVSYNPLDKHVEIGSYPSPLMITTPDENESNNIIKSIIDENIIDKNLSEGNYTELMKTADNIIFNGENFKMNPGDEYCLQLLERTKKYKYETIDYFILDDEARVHDATNKVKIDEEEGDPDYTHVPWIIPGWMMMKARLAEIGTSGLNVRYFYINTIEQETNAHFTFNIRLNVSDPHLLLKGETGSIVEEWCDSLLQKTSDIRFRLRLEKQVDDSWETVFEEDYVDFNIVDKTDGEMLTLGEMGWTDWYGDCRVLWKNISGKISGLTEQDTIKATIAPLLSEENYTIVYDNLEQSLFFDLSKVDSEPFNIGNKTYKFWTENNKQNIHFNVTGSLVTRGIIDLYYEIYDIENNKVKEGKIENWGIGDDNSLSLDYTEDFKKESIYNIKFFFKNETNEVVGQSSRVLITSEIFDDSGFEKSIYDKELTLKDWLLKYRDKCKIDVKYESPTIKESWTSEYYGDNNVLSDGDKKYFTNDEYCTILNPDKISSQICYEQRCDVTLTGTAKTSIQKLEGDLWKDVGINIEANEMPFENTLKTTCWNKYHYKYDIVDSNIPLPDFTLKRYTDFVYNNNTIDNVKLRLSVLGYDDHFSAGIYSFYYDKNWKAFDENDLGAWGSNNLTIWHGLTEAIKTLGFPFVLLEVKFGKNNKNEMWNTLNDTPLDIDNNLDDHFITELKGTTTTWSTYFLMLDQDSTQINPILIPLSKNEKDATRAYQYFCKKIYLVSDVQNSNPKNRYALQDLNEESNLDINLVVTAVINFSAFKIDHNWSLTYDGIIDGNVDNISTEVQTISLGSINVPDSINRAYEEFKMKLENIRIDREDDYDKLEQQPYYYNGIKPGAYFEKNLGNNKVIEFLCANYNTNEYLGDVKSSSYDWKVSFQYRNDEKKWLEYGRVFDDVTDEKGRYIRLDLYWSEIFKNES